MHISWNVIAQDDVNNYDCPTSSFKYSRLYKKYFENKQYDSVQLVLNKWLEYCGEREIVMRSKILLDAKTNSLQERNIPEGMIKLLLEYLERMSYSGIQAKYAYEYNLPRYCYIPIKEQYDHFLTEEFKKLKLNDNQPQINFIIEQYRYEGEQNFNSIEYEPQLRNTPLYIEYMSLKKEDDYDMQELNGSKEQYIRVGFMAGAWIPLNKNNVLGTHPELGIELGTNKKRYNVFLNFQIRFLNSKNEYTVSDKLEGTYSSKRFLSIKPSLDFDYALLIKQKYSMKLVTGAGIDLLETRQQDDIKDIYADNVTTYNLNVGFNLLSKLTNGQELGLYARYHLIDYKINNKVNFNVNPVSIGFLYRIDDKSYNYRYR
jgi:hypothetical protein